MGGRGAGVFPTDALATRLHPQPCPSTPRPKGSQRDVLSPTHPATSVPYSQTTTVSLRGEGTVLGTTAKSLRWL